MASPIAESWAKATLMVAHGTSRGTAFLVALEEADGGRGRIIAVTNKHVISDDPTVRHAVRQVRVHMNERTSTGGLVGTELDAALRTPAGVALWREHPSDDVDVFAFDLTPTIVTHPDLDYRFATRSAFAGVDKRRELDITAGDSVVVVGYPLGLRQGVTNYPLIRQGIIATRIGEELWEEEPDPVGGTRIIKRRGFLYDGAAIPGSSGSPVVLKPEIGRLVGNSIVMGDSPAVLLGIVAQTRYAPVRTPKGDIPSFAGLGFAFDVETIEETLALFS